MAHDIAAIKAAKTLLKTGTTAADAAVIVAEAFETDGAKAVATALHIIVRAAA